MVRIDVITVKERRMPYDGIRKIKTSNDAAKVASEYLSGVDREHFIILLLDTKHQINAIHTVSIGSLAASIVHPREVFKAAIVANASAIIAVHNHPSGDCEPSSEDHVVTKRLVSAGSLLGIEVLDHLILGVQTFYSFREHGAMN